MAKYVLQKSWVWDDNAVIYYGAGPTRTDYPFFYYLQRDNNIQYRKQISKYCSIMFDENFWIVEDSRTVVEKLENKNAYLEMDSETATELERRSWMTLGEELDLEPTPKEVTIIHPNGGGAIYKFHPVHGRLLQCTWINQDGEIFYKSMFVYNDKNFAIKYGNTYGDKWAKVWDQEKKKYLWKT